MRNNRRKKSAELALSVENTSAASESSRAICIFKRSSNDFSSVQGNSLAISTLNCVANVCVGMQSGYMYVCEKAINPIKRLVDTYLCELHHREESFNYMKCKL